MVGNRRVDFGDISRIEELDPAKDLDLVYICVTPYRIRGRYVIDQGLSRSFVCLIGLALRSASPTKKCHSPDFVKAA